MRPGTERVLAAVLAVASPAAATARAADEPSWWAEVREPGLRRWHALVAQARESLEGRRFEDAEGLARAATELLPGRATAWVLLGLALGESARSDAAVDAFAHALDLDPACLDARDGAGGDGAAAAHLAAHAGAWELAHRILTRLLGGLDPEDPARRALYALHADVCLTLGPETLPDAVAAYREVLRGTRRPDARALLGLALALRRRGETLEPFDLAREAAARGHVEARLRLVPGPAAERAARRALALEAIGDVEGARRAWAEAAVDGPWRDQARRELRRLER